MGLFKDMLSSEESLFINEAALDFEFLPKLLPYRENEQHYIATCIKPLLQSRTGKNVLIHGPPGIGKTAAMKFVLRDLEEESDDVYAVYVNCWQKNTTYKILVDICEQLGNKFTHNKRTDELFAWIKQTLNKGAVVFVFDEVDKLDDVDFLYQILEEIFKKTVFLITNYKDWLMDLDERIYSRLRPELLEFKNYNLAETRGIMKQRLDLGFVPNVWQVEGFEALVQKAADIGDIRTGLYLLKQAGEYAEMKNSRKVLLEHAQHALDKMSEFSAKQKAELDEETQNILALVKKNSDKKIGELFKTYQADGGQLVYKSFQRKIRKLADNRFITTKRITGGTEGSTTIVSADTTKKLSEF